MTRVRVESFTISLDGYGAGPDQDVENPLGVGGRDLHQWFIPTRTFQRTRGTGEGTTGIDNDFAERGFRNIGAWILGRNMFGPVRGPWPDLSWKGWWGESPPYHVPVFVRGFTRRSTVHARQRRVATCESAAGLRRYGSIFVRDSLMSCTSPFRRCCLDGASRCTRGSTFGPWGTNASSSSRRRRRLT